MRAHDRAVLVGQRLIDVVEERREREIREQSVPVAQPAWHVHGRQEHALLSEREQQIEVVEREAPADEHLGDVARLLVQRHAEEVVHLGETCEVRGVLREGRTPEDDATTVDAGGVEVRVARLDAEPREVAVHVEEGRALLRHRHHVHSLDEAAQAVDREGVIEELREHRESLLRARGPRAAGAEERQARLGEAVLRGERVRLDLVDEEAVDLHSRERGAGADAHPLRAGDHLRGEVFVGHDLHLQRGVLVREARLELRLELLRRHQVVAGRVDPRSASDAPRQVLREIEVRRVVVERERARAAVELEADLVEAARTDRQQHLVRLAVAVPDRPQIGEQGVMPLELPVELV